MLEQVRGAVNIGMVSVERVRGGFAVYGARGDMILEGELEQTGAVWQEEKSRYFVSDGEHNAEFSVFTRRTKAARAALAARVALAREQGLRMFDNQRARQQRRVTREIEAVYLEAMREHREEIERLRRAADALPDWSDPAEYFRLMNQRKELESVYNSLADGLSKAGQSAYMLMNSELQRSAAISRNVMSWQIDNMAGMRVSRFVGHDFASLAVTGIGTYHGRYDLKAWQGVADRAECRRIIKNAVARGLLTGEHPERIAKRIEGVFTGNEPLSPHARAVRIARTETNRVMSEVAQQTIKAANASGIKIKNRWDATLDSKTRESHRKVDGEVREPGDRFSNGARRPGDGGAAESINCRCALVPVLDGFKPDAPIRRDNDTGELIPYMTYSEWERMNNGVTD